MAIPSKLVPHAQKWEMGNRPGLLFFNVGKCTRLYRIAFGRSLAWAPHRFFNAKSPHLEPKRGTIVAVVLDMHGAHSLITEDVPPQVWLRGDVEVYALHDVK
jgi:hypothetical protein